MLPQPRYNQLSSWINRSHLEENKIKEYQKSFSQNQLFSHLQIKKIFVEEKVIVLLSALSQEKFSLKRSDLFTFFQTNDFAGMENKIIQEFRAFLASPEFLEFIEDITGIKLAPNIVDMTASLYQDTHFLLPHDDRLKGRTLAYSYYLSTLQDGEGGALLLYDSEDNKPVKISKKILPELNSFMFFLVSKKSFHEVEEVVGSNCRLAISGWLHGY